MSGTPGEGGGCQVFVVDHSNAQFDVECGLPYAGDITVHLPIGKGRANVRVCTKHKSILNARAARLRAEAKQVG